MLFYVGHFLVQDKDFEYEFEYIYTHEYEHKTIKYVVIKLCEHNSKLV